MNKEKLIRKFQIGARTYLFLAGAGTALCVLAPFAAAFQILKPDPDSEKAKKQRIFFHQLNSSIEKAGKQLHEALKDFDPLNGFDPFDPFGNEPWKQQHQKQHNMSDEEWGKRNDD